MRQAASRRSRRAISVAFSVPSLEPATVRLSDSLKKRIEALAVREGCSVNQFLTTAVLEKPAAIDTTDYLRAEAAAGRRGDFEKYLAAVPRAPVVADTDRLP